MYEETLIPRQREQAPIGSDRPLAATIFNTPAADGDDVYVTIEGIDGGEEKHGPCRYMPRGAALPSDGDEAIVAFDDENQIWIIGWWPYG